MDLNELKTAHPEVYAAAVNEGVAKERDRVGAHLTLGTQSGAMETAVNAVKGGSELTATLQAEYMAASMKKNANDTRGDDNADTGAVDGADTNADADAAPDTDTDATPDKGDAVVNALANAMGLGNTNEPKTPFPPEKPKKRKRKMANLTITSVDERTPIYKDPVFNDGLLTVAGAGTVLAGTILAVDSVSKKYVVFEKGGTTNENGIPKAVLTYDVVAAGAGDEAIRAMTAGEVIKERLVISADGDDSNIDKDVVDQLRDYAIIPQYVTQLNIADNS